jgi:uncharacterized protein
MTKLKIEDIPEEGIQIQLLEEEAHLKELFGQLPQINFSLDKAVRGHLMINKSGKAILIGGQIETELILRCSRCLEDFRYPLDSRCEVTLFPFEDETLPQEEELNMEDMRSSYYYEGEIDLSAVVREQILLDIPYKPLCSPSCKGLCPSCGEDLNRGSCSCKGEVFDERFAPLKGLKIGQRQKGH